ncbi:hypothetical protein B0H17DRAFT_1031616, partial [Mycena rosella]
LPGVLRSPERASLMRSRCFFWLLASLDPYATRAPIAPQSAVWRPSAYTRCRRPVSWLLAIVLVTDGDHRGSASLRY